jgi:hypothetical protein
MTILSLPSFALTKFYNCKTDVNGINLELYIEQDTDDFFRPVETLPPIYKSKIIVKTDTFEYELDKKGFDSSSDSSLKFESNMPPITIAGTTFKLVEIFLYDKYEDMDKDDFFFGKLENTEEGKDHYVSNFSNFGGELMHIFKCDRY